LLLLGTQIKDQHTLFAWLINTTQTTTSPTAQRLVPMTSRKSAHWGMGGTKHWSHRLVTKLPGKNSPNVQAFTASIILMGVLCLPKYLSSKNTKPGHGMFDQEQPEEIQLQRAEQRRQAAEARSLKEWQKIKEEQ